jgi:hypothetical protein
MRPTISPAFMSNDRLLTATSAPNRLVKPLISRMCSPAAGCGRDGSAPAAIAGGRGFSAGISRATYGTNPSRVRWSMRTTSSPKTTTS